MKFFPPRIGEPVFTRKQIMALLIPLVIEQILTQMIGLIGTIMVARVGEHAMSGVAIVDSINQIVLSLFTALATGGTIVTSQFIGRGDRESAGVSAKQVVIVATSIAALFGIICALFRVPILNLIYDVERSVMDSASVYFLFTSMSFPFMALFASTSSIFRATGNARLPMLVSVLMNIINVALNALFIFGLGLGSAGPALAALTSRVVGSTITTIKLSSRGRDINISGIFPIKLNIPMIKNILMIGIPNGVENSMLQFGRLLNQSIISRFGTAAIAAASIGNHINVVTLMPGAAVGTALLTVVGQCVGAGKYDQARRYTVSFTAMGMASIIFLNVLCFIFMDNIIMLFNASVETAALARKIIVILILASGVFWPLAFSLPNALRAANDVKFTMTTSIGSMFFVRILSGYIMSFHTPIAEMGVWYALMLDWSLRGFACLARFLGDRWTKHKILSASAR